MLVPKFEIGDQVWIVDGIEIKIGRGIVRNCTIYSDNVTYYIDYRRECVSEVSLFANIDDALKKLKSVLINHWFPVDRDGNETNLLSDQ